MPNVIDMTKEELVQIRKVVADVCEDPSDELSYDAIFLRVIDQLLRTMD